MTSFIPKKDMPGREVLSKKTEQARKDNQLKEAREGKKDYKAPKLTLTRGKDGSLC